MTTPLLYYVVSNSGSYDIQAFSGCSKMYSSDQAQYADLGIAPGQGGGRRMIQLNNTTMYESSNQTNATKRNL